MSSIPVPKRADERKLVTILFADLVGSTDLGERLDPERLQSILETYFGAMTRIIDRWGGTVEKYIGDAIMAVFGVPAAHEDDPRRAIGAAVEMLAAIDGLNVQFHDRYGVELRARIGVNTGNVIAPVGGPDGQFLVVGDAVNVAARLEQAADPATVLVGERTHAAATEQFAFGEPLTLEVRGKSKPILAWRVIGPRVDDLDGQRRLESPLVGRDRERRAMVDALDDAIESGRPHLVLVFGPAGIGKSRLVREFAVAAGQGHADLHVARGRCLSAGDGITFWALGEIVRHEFGIALDDPADLARARLESGVRAVLEPMGAAEADIAHTVNSMAISAGIRIPDNPLTELRPIAVAAELARAWPRFATARAAAGPLVLLIEDLHWADDQLIAILDSLRARASGPLLVAATARPEFAEDHPGFNVAGEGVTSLTLRPLLDGEAALVLGNLVGLEALPAALREEVLDRAEGNPFFLEQLVGGLVDSGALAREADSWTFRGGAGSNALPDTVQAVLAARIDRLDANHKLVLQEAAVVGRTFWPAAVALSIDREQVGEALDSLEAKGLLQARSGSSIGGESEYAFKHALILDVAYASVPLARRARSHARVGAWLQGVAGPADEGLQELVAHHYRMALLADGADLAWLDDPEERGRIRARAFDAIVGAGAIARRRNAIERAVELHEAALELAIDDLERASVYEELGDDHGSGYHGDPSVEAWTRALALLRAADDGEAIARICLKAARASALYWGGFAARPSGASIDAFVDEGLAHTATTRTRAWLLAMRGRAAEAWAAEALPDPVAPSQRLAAAQEAWEMALTVDDPDLRVIANRTLSGQFIQAGDEAKALELARRELTMVEDVAFRDRVFSMQTASGLLMDIGGDFEAAADLAQRALPLARELGRPHDQMHATYFAMAPLYRLGRWEAIEPLALEHLRNYDAETVDMNCPYTRSGPVIAAIVLERLGRDAEAHEAEQRIAPNPERPGLVEGWMGERALSRKNPVQAREIAERSLAAHRRPSVEEPPYELAVLLQAATMTGDAVALAEAIPLARARVSRMVWLAPLIDRAEAVRLESEGEPRAARAALKRAAKAYRRFGMPDPGLPDAALKSPTRRRARPAGRR